MSTGEISSTTQQAWWGEFSVAPDETLRTDIAGMTLAVTRRRSEWQVWTERDSDAVSEAAAEPRRYVFNETDGTVHLTPRLADRPVIMRPISPVSIVPGAEIEMYVSSPVLVTVAVGDAQIILEESFVTQPSDTWFGSSTIAGTLCYASRTRARLQREELLPRAERAITAVHVANQSGESLTLERLALPTPNLSVFADRSGTLYTEDITIVREDDEELASLNVSIGPPPYAADAELITKSREESERHSLFRAFGKMFS